MSTLLHWLPGMLVLAVTAALLWRALGRSDEPARLAWKWLATFLIVSGVWLFAGRTLGSASGGGSYAGNFAIATLITGVIAVAGILLGIIWGSALGELLAKPLTALFDDGSTQLKPKPLYSIAIAQRKQGHAAEAIAEIERQLARFPDDFEGSLLKAEVEALDLQDVAAATATLQNWIPPSRRDHGHQAVVLTKLADWQLHVTHDVAGARRCLESIVQTLPQTEAAFLAEQRLAHLAFEAETKNTLITMEAGLGTPVATGTPPPVPPRGPDAETGQLVEHLQSYPHDVAARERLALLYAWEYRHADLARQEIETLLQLRKASPREIARGLNLLADVEIQIAGNLEGARAALNRLIALDPQAAAAQQARNRLPFLLREMARHQHPRIVGQTP